MPLATSEQPLYVLETFWFRIPAAYLDGVALTDADPPDTFTWELVDVVGTVLDSGSMAHSATTDGTWEAEIAAPATAGTYHLHATATDGASLGRWHDWISVKAFV